MMPKISSKPRQKRTFELTQKQIEHLGTLSGHVQKLAEKAYKKECSARMAIKAKCQECVGYEEMIKTIRDCTVWRCPLHRYRPYQPR